MLERVAQKYKECTPVLLRLGIGLVLVPRGAQHFPYHEHWPHHWGPIAATIELAGGICLIAGLFTRLAAAVLAIYFLLTIILELGLKALVGPFAHDQFYFICLSMSMCVFLVGPGPWSVDRWETARKAKSA